ncbi:hypothetical protein M1N64_05065 [Peptococcaceae bacterium]|nr:hypothetical protein [Peptococcaceae bacterium]
MTFVNLDFEAAKTAQAIIKDTTIINANSIKAKEVEILITKSLGVLQTNGVYAGILYLYSRSGKDAAIAKIVREKMLGMLKHLSKKTDESIPTDTKLALAYVANNICNDLDKLLLTKQLWEQTLIYARYGAKARGE